MEIEMKTSNNSKIIYEYNVLRVIVTILVVIGHAKSYSIITNYGGVNYSIYSDPNLSVNYLLSKLIRLIYTFHMPLFMALSGALFFISFNRNKYKTVMSVVADKSKRLLIPFFVVTFLYASPIKLLSGYWTESNNVIKDIIIGQVLLQGNSHLWFLVALFGIFIIEYLVEKYAKSHEVSKILMFLCLYVISRKMPIRIIHYVFENVLWFYLGYLFEPRREKINSYISTNTTVIANVGFLVLFILSELSFMDKMMIHLGFSIILSVSGCVSVYMISYLLSDKITYSNGSLYKLTSEFSLGIYLYSDPLNYIILFGVYNLFGEFVFNSTIGIIALFVSRIVITFAVSLIISILLRKAKVKYIF